MERLVRAARNYHQEDQGEQNDQDKRTSVMKAAVSSRNVWYFKESGW